MSEAMNRKPRILLTSAAGRTSTPAVLAPLQQGLPVRAFVRREDARSAALQRAGAEIFVGDLLDMRDLRRALTDVQRAYDCPPLHPNLLHGAMVSTHRPRTRTSVAWRRATRRPGTARGQVLPPDRPGARVAPERR